MYNEHYNRGDTDMNELSTFTNKDTNMKSFVTIGSFGFHVSLQDLDSGEFVTTVKCFNNEEKAVEHAKKLVA